MNKKTISFAITKFLVDIIIVSIIIFGAAGEFFLSGCILVFSIFIFGLLYGIVMTFKFQKIMIKRLNDREQNISQLILMALSIVVLILTLISAGISVRYKLYILPNGRYLVSILFFLFSIIIYFKVVTVNEFITTAIKTVKYQYVINTGPYRIIRHPMYASMLILLFSAELLIGSALSIIVSVLFIPIVIIRIKIEEELLTNELEGYIEYKKKVRYRLIPFIW